MCVGYVFLFRAPDSQYSPVVEILRKGNSVVTSERSTDLVGDCAPCADSELTLKEQIAKLDDMELVDGDDSDCEKMVEE